MRTLPLIMLSHLAWTTVPATASPAPGARTPHTVVVSAVGTSAHRPDRAVFVLGVKARAKTARQALKDNGQRMAGLIEGLRTAGVPETHLRTEQLMLAPEYVYKPEQEPRLAGYRAEHQLRVQCDDEARLGEWIDLAVELGADQIVEVQYELSDPARASHMAREHAMRAAHRQAKQLAQLARRRLGPVLSVEEFPAKRQPEAFFSTYADAPRTKSPVEPGVLDVLVELEVVFALR